MFADVKFDELGKALAWIEGERTRHGSTGGTHALATRFKPRDNDQGCSRGDRGGRGGRSGGGRGKRDGRCHHH